MHRPRRAPRARARARASRAARSAMRRRGRSRRLRRPPRHALCSAPLALLRRRAGGSRPIELPTPALPGSGSTVGGDQPPSQPGPSELPYVTSMLEPVTVLFGGIPVHDFDAAAQWYERLLRRAPDMRPHDHEACWKLTDEAWIYL